MSNIIGRLPAKSKQQLIYALNQGISQMVELPDGNILGVYISHLPQIEVLESSGPWALVKRRKTA